MNTSTLSPPPPLKDGNAARPASAPSQTAPETAQEQQRVLLHMPVDVRSAALALLAFLASMYALQWAAAVAIPLMLGLMFSYAMSPAVDWMEKKRIPRWAGAALILLGLAGGLSWTAFSLADDATELVESLPAAAQKLRESVHEKLGNAPGPLDKVQKAAVELEKTASETVAVAGGAAVRGVTRVQIVPPRFNVHDYLWSSTMGLINFAGKTAIVCMQAYFLVIAGSAFRRKMVRIAGPTFTQKKITIQALDEMTEQVQRYLLVQVLISILVGVATWLAFVAIGMRHAEVWGIAAAVFNMVPYVGSLAIAAASALVALMQFGTLDMAVAVAAICTGIHVVSGYILNPWLTSRTSRLSPVTVFVAVLVWGWLWGVGGMLLGVPITMIIKAACDRIDGLKPVGELMGV